VPGPGHAWGCGALCPSYHRGCYGCFGPMEAPNPGSLGPWLAAHGLPERDVVRLYRTFYAGTPASAMPERTILTEALARVEGEGALHVRLRDGRVEDVRLRIYEPPRFFDAFLRGRRVTEVPDITARICGICPVAYQMSSIAAMEDLCGVEVPEPVRVLRRLVDCGEWVESHALHVFMLHTRTSSATRTPSRWRATIASWWRGRCASSARATS
jgi:hypothetical protein